MFDDIHSGISHLTGQFQDAVRDPFGQSFFGDVLEPVVREINALMAMQENTDSELSNLDMLRSEIASMKSEHE